MIKEKRWHDGGLSGGYNEVRVRKLAQGEAIPEGAISLPDDAAAYDWTPEHQVKEGV